MSASIIRLPAPRGASPLVCCPRCNGAGEYHVSHEAWNDCGPQGGFMTTIDGDVPCGCGAIVADNPPDNLVDFFPF